MRDPPYTGSMRVRRTAIDAITAHARRESPCECCGLLIGAAGEITEAVAARNVAAEPHRHYQVSPVDYFAQIKRCRELTQRGTPASVVGVYHSHPHSRPEPSPTDLEQAFEDFLYVIAGPVTGGEIGVRGYQLREEKFEPVALIVSPSTRR